MRLTTSSSTLLGPIHVSGAQICQLTWWNQTMIFIIPTTTLTGLNATICRSHGEEWLTLGVSVCSSLDSYCFCKSSRLVLQLQLNSNNAITSIGYPVISYFRKVQLLKSTFNLGGANATGQVCLSITCPWRSAVNVSTDPITRKFRSHRP